MKKFLKYFLIFLAALLIISYSFTNGKISKDDDIDKFDKLTF